MLEHEVFSVDDGSGDDPSIEEPSVGRPDLDEPSNAMARALSRPSIRRRLLLGGLALALSALVFLLWPYWDLSSHFQSRLEIQPSRLYGQPTVLAVGDLHGQDAVLADLRAEGYREALAAGPLSPGRYRESRGGLEVHLRRFLTAEGLDGGQLVELGWRGSRVRSLTVGGDAVSSLSLPPPLLASYYDDRLEERWPVTVDDVPEDLIEAVLAAEDATFFDHAGLSMTGILRAMWVNLTGGEIRQGGSTLTQQLVKNLYLSPERTVARKTREALLALLLEMRYEKREILEAYLNEIYLGASGGVNLLGVGAASRVYFSKEPRELDLAEAATIAALIRAPAHYSPIEDPDKARERRDWVLGRMEELGWVEPERVARARERPVTADPHPVVRRRAPYFARAVAEEAARRFGVGDLNAGGYVLLSTLSARDQREAREAVQWGLPALEKGWQKGARVQGPLQAALVSLDPRSGGILAYVGGRDWSQSQFDRAGQARRQAGSAFKPVVFAAAFADRKIHPASWLDDSPLTVSQAGREWSPRNYDGEYHGWITARTALERSLNTATARLALQVGMPRIVELAEHMGIAGPMDPVPALALGAVELTPLEMAAVYSTLANGGLRPPVHALEAVRDPQGEWVEAGRLPQPERALSPEVAFVLTSVLQGVIDRGTGRGVRRMGLNDPVAGKSGTTNGRRDNWFAGYSPDRATAVWVGYDDNSETRMSGARAALPIWTRFVSSVRPAGGYRSFDQPAGVVTAVIDPESGGLATDRCPEVLTEVFLEDQVPGRMCPLHGWDRWQQIDDSPRGGERRRHPIRRWLDRVFGDGPR